MIQAWYQLVPEINIFIDRITNDEIQQLKKINKRAKIHFYVDLHPEPPILKTFYENEYRKSQFRHIPAIYHTFHLFPDKKFYFFGDDDTYIFPNQLLAFARTKNPRVPTYYGFPFFFLHSNPFGNYTYLFLQGGAGLLMTHQFLTFASPDLLKCSDILKDPTIYSDAKLGICIQESIIQDVTITKVLNQFNTLPPHKSPPLTKIDHSFISYHHIIDNITIRLWNATISEFSETYINWNPYSFQEIEIPLSETGRHLTLMWGYCFFFSHFNYSLPKDIVAWDAPRNVSLFSSISQMEPYYENKRSIFPFFKKRKEIKYFIQKFEGNLEVILPCIKNNNQTRKGEIIFDHFESREKDRLFFLANCPNEIPFIYKSTDHPPLSVHIIPQDDAYL